MSRPKRGSKKILGRYCGCNSFFPMLPAKEHMDFWEVAKDICPVCGCSFLGYISKETRSYYEYLSAITISHIISRMELALKKPGEAKKEIQRLAKIENRILREKKRRKEEGIPMPPVVEKI